MSYLLSSSTENELYKISLYLLAFIFQTQSNRMFSFLKDQNFKGENWRENGHKTSEGSCSQHLSSQQPLCLYLYLYSTSVFSLQIVSLSWQAFF